MTTPAELVDSLTTSSSSLNVSFRVDVAQGDNDDDTGGSSSGSGTDEGYGGSASSNACLTERDESPSDSSSLTSTGLHTSSRKRPRTAHHRCGRTGDSNRPMLHRKDEAEYFSSSVIADFSSSDGEDDDDDDDYDPKMITAASAAPAVRTEAAKVETGSTDEWPMLPLRVRAEDLIPRTHFAKTRAAILKNKVDSQKPLVMGLGCDIMAHVLTFLEPENILDVLTMPLSKSWLTTYTRQPELWRILCLMEPFLAPVDDFDDDSDEESDPFLVDVQTELHRTFGNFRIKYTLLVRCVRYLSRIKDDALHGRSPSMIDYVGVSASSTPTDNNRSFMAATNINLSGSLSTNLYLQEFLSRAREAGESRSRSILEHVNGFPASAPSEPIGTVDDGSSSSCVSRRKRTKLERNNLNVTKSSSLNKPQYAHSMITSRLLGPAANGAPGLNVNLPWSCAIYSIINWMVALADVEGIQTMCLKVLPLLLEDEQQRSTAQLAGLTEAVLRNMVCFPNSASLHKAAFHTIVLLARPLGGREGMLFNTSMVNSSGIFAAVRREGENVRNGIAVLLDSMRRFRSDPALQAMSCWSLVNIALAPAQKEALVKLGGIEVTTSAMRAHPFSAEVQFRALFSLINLLIPTVVPVILEPSPSGSSGHAAEIFCTASDEESEQDIVNGMVEQIVQLVVTAMKNFCASEAILNRACLVLHNLSLTESFRDVIILSEGCYQMLEWCLGNYKTDQVLQQSATGTIHRLQLTLSNNESLRNRFTASLRVQQQLIRDQANQNTELHSLQTQG
jgi:hypothetical protein